MTISPPEVGKLRKPIDRNTVPATFELFGKPGHFDRSLAKGPKNHTWVWNLHAQRSRLRQPHDDLEEVSRKIFSAHFGHLAVIFIWLSGAFYHGARFSITHRLAGRSPARQALRQVVWPIFGPGNSQW